MLKLQKFSVIYINIHIHNLLTFKLENISIYWLILLDPRSLVVLKKTKILRFTEFLLYNNIAQSSLYACLLWSNDMD